MLLRKLDLGETTPPEAHDGSERLAICGRFVEYVNVQGKLAGVSWRCGMFRDCARCNAERVMVYRNRVIGLLEHGVTLSAFTIPAGSTRQEVAKIMERIGHDNYLRLPQDDGSYYVVAEAHADLPQSYEPSALAEADVRAMDWHKLVSTPHKWRITGNLGRPEKPVTESDEENVLFEHMPHVLTDADSDARATCFMQALVEDSEQPAPTDVAELTVAMARRTDLYAAKLSAAGHTVTVVHDRMWGRINRSNIAKNYLRLIPGQNYQPKDYIDDYTRWRACVDVVKVVSLDVKVDGD